MALIELYFGTIKYWPIAIVLVLVLLVVMVIAVVIIILKISVIKKMNISHDIDVKSLELQAAIVEPILKLCAKEVTMEEIQQKADCMFTLSHTIAKMYLFYLIDYGVISYNGQKQIFLLEDEGYDLLYKIEQEKRHLTTNINDIVIIFECDAIS